MGSNDSFCNICTNPGSTTNAESEKSTRIRIQQNFCSNLDPSPKNAFFDVLPDKNDYFTPISTDPDTPPTYNTYDDLTKDHVLLNFDIINQIDTHTFLVSYQDDIKYKGKFRNYQRSGFGKQTWPNGNSYEGNFEDDMFNGLGHLKFHNGDYYKGNFRDGTLNGYGEYSNKDANSKGQWRNNKKNGKFTETINNGETFEGVYVDGKKNGFGVHIWPDGSRYTGNFVNDLAQGEGS